MLAKFDHCVIHVSDWERSNAFYHDVLGAELVDRGAGTWAYRFGTEQLNVHGPEQTPIASLGSRWRRATATSASNGPDRSRARQPTCASTTHRDRTGTSVAQRRQGWRNKRLLSRPRRKLAGVHLLRRISRTLIATGHQPLSPGPTVPDSFRRARRRISGIAALSARSPGLLCSVPESRRRSS